MLETVPSAMDAQAAYERDQRAEQLVRSIAADCLALGQLLRVQFEARDWDALGYSSWGAYLARPGFGMGTTQAGKLMAVAKTYLPAHTGACVTPAAWTPQDVAEMGIEAAYRVREFVTADDPERAQEWISRAKELSLSDLERAIKEETRATPYTEHQAWLEEVMYQCIAVLRRLPEAADPISVLEDVIGREMRAVERLKARAVGGGA